MSEAKCETGWGESPSTRALFETRDRHPTPPLLSVASTLPLQGRVKKILSLCIKPYRWRTAPIVATLIRRSCVARQEPYIPGALSIL